LNELISAIHEKDELLDSQEDLLIKENKKYVKVKNAYALEVEKCEKLTSELSTCHDTISSLRNENAKLIVKVEKTNVCDDSIVNLRNDNASLIAKIDMLNESLASLKFENERLIAKAKDLNDCNISISNLRDENVILHDKIVELNTCKPSTSTVEHVTICTRCRDINIDDIHDHLALIKQQNDHIAQLSAKINEHELENEKFKFARSMLYSGRRPSIKDGIGFQQGDNIKLNGPLKRLSNFVKGKAPMPQDNEGYILYPAGYPEDKIRRIYSRKSHSGSHHAFMYKSEASSFRQLTCHRFDPGGSLDRRVKLSLRAPAQMGWREMEHKGENRGSCYPAPGGCACSRGYKRSRGRERESASRFVSPSSRATPLYVEALDLPFIDARRGSRCTMGV
jgi:hypothetical protein